MDVQGQAIFVKTAVEVFKLEIVASELCGGHALFVDRVKIHLSLHQNIRLSAAESEAQSEKQIEQCLHVEIGSMPILFVVSIAIEIRNGFSNNNFEEEFKLIL